MKLVNLKKAIWYMLLSYWIVTVKVVLFIIALGAIYHLPGAAELGVSVGRSPAYLMSMPWHPLFNLPIWLLFSRGYLKRVSTDQVQAEGWRLGLFWGLIAVVKDYLVWVLIPSPIQMTHYEMYVEYQPWLTLIYLVIFLCPVLTGLSLSRRAATSQQVAN